MSTIFRISGFVGRTFAGMELLAVYDAYTLNPATEDSERLFFVAREKGKKKQ